jgi:hypothetical protein
MNRVAAASLFLFARMKLRQYYLFTVTCLLLSACQPEVVLVEVTRVVFRDGVATASPAQVVTESVEVTRVVIAEVTRVVEQVVTNEVGVLDNEQAVIDLMCAAPVETIGFLTAVGYMLAHEQCGVQVAAVAQDDIGLTWQMGMIVVRDDSNIDSLADLAGRRGAVPDLDRDCYGRR